MPISTWIILAVLGVTLVFSLYAGVRDLLTGELTIADIIGAFWREHGFEIIVCLLAVAVTLIFGTKPRPNPDDIPSVSSIPAEEQKALIQWE
jgi:hypothetical protein